MTRVFVAALVALLGLAETAAPDESVQYLYEEFCPAVPDEICEIYDGVTDELEWSGRCTAMCEYYEANQAALGNKNCAVQSDGKCSNPGGPCVVNGVGGYCKTLKVRNRSPPKQKYGCFCITPASESDFFSGPLLALVVGGAAVIVAIRLIRQRVALPSMP
jgi:hypothetical protein